ncbi:tyrosine-protein kinase SRK3-like [Hyperolius riggenbachi]|uniref:tyrosine-protein kinase SRK3-like n=1 Tax=Hyperolius riggenbachi TaxID=752182 RepID=UPI0035A3B28C
MPPVLVVPTFDAEPDSGMKLVFENGKPVLIREGIKKIRKIPMEGKKVDQQDGKKVLVLEEPGIEQIHKKVPLEGKDIVIENGKPVLLLKDPIIQTVWLQIPLSGQKVAFQEGDDPLLVIEDPGIIQIHKKNPLIVIENAEPGVQKIKDKIPFIVKKIVLKDNKPVLVVEKQESKQKISLEVSLPQVQFVPKEDIHVDESCLLGAGNFGKVFKGCFQGTPAAVKTIRCNDTELNDIFHEIQVSMKLHHPNIVKLMAATKTDTHILLASEYIHGDNLDRILHNPKSIVQISEDDKKYIALEMLLAMEYIHSQNVLHQDVKPANVLVEARSKKALLTDWGMANVRVTICTQMYAKIGPYGGTKMYMAPECTMENKSATKMSDMWSVGATIVELFTKQMPWTSLQEMYPNMFMKQAPKSLASMDGKLPIVKSCFSYDPKQRPTAANMVVAIKNMEGVDLAKHYGFTW